MDHVIYHCAHTTGHFFTFFIIFSIPVIVAGFEPSVRGLEVKWSTTRLTKQPIIFLPFGILYLPTRAAAFEPAVLRLSQMCYHCATAVDHKNIFHFFTLILGLWVKWSTTVLIPQAIIFYFFSSFSLSRLQWQDWNPWFEDWRLSDPAQRSQKKYFFYLFGIFYLPMIAAWLGLRTRTKSNVLPLCYCYGPWHNI